MTQRWRRRLLLSVKAASSAGCASSRAALAMNCCGVAHAEVIAGGPTATVVCVAVPLSRVVDAVSYLQTALDGQALFADGARMEPCGRIESGTTWHP